MKLWKFFRRKTDEELFDKAVSEKNHVLTIAYGARLLGENKLEFRKIIAYSESLYAMNRIKEAVEILDRYAQEKINSGYFSEAIPMLKKSSKFNPECVITAKLLSFAYESKNLLFEAFQTLINLFKNRKKSGKSTSEARKLIENFLERHPLPDLLKEYEKLTTIYYLK
ncbi:hypothetical protein [Desulfurobacterium sp.]